MGFSPFHQIDWT